MKNCLVLLLFLIFMSMQVGVNAFNAPSNHLIALTTSRGSEYRIDKNSVAWNGSIVVFDVYVGYEDKKQKFGDISAYSSFQKFRANCSKKTFIIDSWMFFDTNANAIKQGSTNSGWRPFTESHITKALTSVACAIGS